MGHTFRSLVASKVVLVLICEVRFYSLQKEHDVSYDNFKEGEVPYDNLRSGAVLGHSASWTRITGKDAEGIRLGIGHALRSKRGAV